jgi:membrane protease YdiL (CAAX protease family)
METQIKNRSALKDRSKLYLNIGEIFIVFLAPLLIISSMGTWVADDPLRSMGVVSVGNAIMLLMIWTGLKLRGESWADFGLTFRTISFKKSLKVFGLSLLVFVIGSAAYIVGGALMANVTGVPESADFSIYDYLNGNLGMLFLSLGSVYIISSFGEEVIYRAFLINRIAQFGISTKYGTAIAVIISSVIFGLVHYQWGLMGMIQTGFMGLAFGICYIKLKKRLWILILAHAYMDTILIVQMYLSSN